jgi:predicted RNase H-like HicB family nuclease
MKTYSAVIERCPRTKLYVGFVPGFPGAHSQGETLDELNHNLQEVIAMLIEDGEPTLESEFIPDCPLGHKPLPTSPCQGRRRFSSPPDKGELEGVFEPISPNGLFGFIGVQNVAVA